MIKINSSSIFSGFEQAKRILIYVTRRHEQTKQKLKRHSLGVI